MTNKFEQLKTEGVATVPYPETLRISVVEASQLWAQFLDLPQDVRDSYAMTDGSIGSGYERKEGVGVNADVKQNFDVSAKSIDSMPRGVETEAATQFIDAAKDLSDRMTTYAVETAQEIGDVFDIDSLRTISANGLETFVRFLRYPAGTTEGALLAQPHTDQSGFTFHLYEDTDGCERLSLDKSSWESMPVHGGEAAIFGAMQLQYQSDGEIPALSHRVVANKVSQNAGRIAIVCFVRFTELPFYDKDANGRLQEVEPGKFYGMATEEFKKSFRS